MVERINSAKNYVFFVALIAFISLLIGTYFYNFACNPIDGFGWCPESTKEEWGQFGDFVGGILNPSLSLIVIFIAVRTYEMQRKMAAKQESLFSTQRFLEVCTPVIKSLDFLLDSQPALKSEDDSDQIYKELTIRQMLALIDNKIRHLSGLYTDFGDGRTKDAIKQLARDQFWDDFYVPIKVLEMNPKFIEQLSVMIKLSDRCGVESSQLSDFFLSLLRDEESLRGLYIYTQYMNQAHTRDNSSENKKIAEIHKIVSAAVVGALVSLDKESVSGKQAFKDFLFKCFESIFNTRS